MEKDSIDVKSESTTVNSRHGINYESCSHWKVQITPISSAYSQEIQKDYSKLPYGHMHLHITFFWTSVRAKVSKDKLP